MTKEQMENQLYTYEELIYTFLAGSRMVSEQRISLMEAFEKWMEHIEIARKARKSKSN